MTLEKLMMLHLCNLCQGDGGAGVCFEFLMTLAMAGSMEMLWWLILRRGDDEEYKMS
jgi:hypothetical protein